jgi:hypothetical protein
MNRRALLRELVPLAIGLSGVAMGYGVAAAIGADQAAAALAEQELLAADLADIHREVRGLSLIMATLQRERSDLAALLAAVNSLATYELLLDRRLKIIEAR